MKTFDHEIFCEKVYKLFENEKQESVAKKLGIKQGYVSDIKNKKAKAPSLDLIIRIAEEYKISVDYLLGLTDVQTRDLQTKELCNALGLSEDAVWTLKQAKDMCFDLEECKIPLIDTISDFLASTSTLPMFSDMCIMQWNVIMQNKSDIEILFDEPISDDLAEKMNDWLSRRDSIDLEMFRATKEFQKIADEMIEKVSNEKS